jgi:hypothetical protein
MPGLGIDPCEPPANDRLAGVLLAHLKLADVGELQPHKQHQLPSNSNYIHGC